MCGFISGPDPFKLYTSWLSLSHTHFILSFFCDQGTKSADIRHSPRAACSVCEKRGRSCLLAVLRTSALLNVSPLWGRPFWNGLQLVIRTGMNGLPRKKYFCLKCLCSLKADKSLISIGSVKPPAQTMQLNSEK